MIGFLVHIQWDVTFFCVWIVFAGLPVCVYGKSILLSVNPKCQQ